MNTRRHFRNTFPLNSIKPDLDKHGNTCKLPSGFYCNNKINVHDDGSFTVLNKCYVDDVVAFLSGCIHSNPTISQDIKSTLHTFLNQMDDRALQRHGYEESREKDYEWKKL